MTAPVPIDMEQFTDAVHNWFSEATGLQTIWQDQSAPRPDYPYASLIIISGPTPDSPVWEQRTTFDASRPLEEIEFNACVPCTFTIGTQVYVTAPDSRNPTQNATHYAAIAQGALNLHNYRANLKASGIAVVDQGAINNIDEVIDDAFVSRASMDVIFRAALNTQSYETYIETVELSSATLGIDMEVSL